MWTHKPNKVADVSLLKAVRWIVCYQWYLHGNYSQLCLKKGILYANLRVNWF